jgi:hypothetical protein
VLLENYMTLETYLPRSISTYGYRGIIYIRMCRNQISYLRNTSATIRIETHPYEDTHRDITDKWQGYNNLRME